MKPTLRQRWIQWMFISAREDHRRGNSFWTSSMMWGSAIVLGLITVANIQMDFTIGAISTGFGAFMNLMLGFAFWERFGWVELVIAKDAEIRELRKSRDRLLRERAPEKFGEPDDGPETRFQE